MLVTPPILIFMHTVDSVGLASVPSWDKLDSSHLTIAIVSNRGQD